MSINIIIYILVTAGVAGIIKYREIINPYTLFNILWIVVLMLIDNGNYYIDPPSETALNCIILGVISYNCSMLIPLAHFKIRKVRNSDNIGEYKINYNLALKFSNISVVVCTLLSVQPLVRFLSGSNFGIIRTDYYTYGNFLEYFLWYARLYTISASRDVIFIIALFAFITNYKSKFRLLFNAIMLIILESVMSGGRYVLMNAGFMIFCFYLRYSDKVRLKRKQKIMIGGTLITFFGLIIFFTSNRVTYLYSRLSALELIQQTFYGYFAGSVTYLGRLITTYSADMGTTYGVNFMQGFILPIFTLFGFVGISTPEVINKVGNLTVKPLAISAVATLNALPTVFGYFYVDGKMTAVIIESFLFGYICKKIYSRSTRNNTIYFAAYLLLVTQILNTSTKWFFYQSDYCFAFLYLFLFFRRKEFNDEKNVKNVIDQA